MHGVFWFANVWFHDDDDNIRSHNNSALDSILLLFQFMYFFLERTYIVSYTSVLLLENAWLIHINRSFSTLLFS
jgi:hypothetical protein